MENRKYEMEEIISVAEFDVDGHSMCWHEVAEYHEIKLPPGEAKNVVEVTTKCGERREFPVWSWLKPIKSLDHRCTGCFDKCFCYKCDKKQTKEL